MNTAATRRTAASRRWRPQLLWSQHPAAAATALLAALAYLPALTAAPGRMPADSKLYLYLDPGRLISDGWWSFDARQFAGWVPHQHITFLWPSGPWFYGFDRLGVPDWIAHRLWIGSLLLAAGGGVLWCARLLGLRWSGALAAAVLYQLSPYLLPYVSRTSVMLLTWAGMGWIIGLSIRSLDRRDWRSPALLALVVATVGSVNVTALAMIVPGPVLWLAYAGWERIAPWRQVAAVALRIAALSAVVSSWWITMSILQRRYGAPVLDYSESLQDVARTSSAPEVLRGLGYWLFYIRDAFGATTEASLPHLVSTGQLLIAFAVVVIAFIAFATLNWAPRRFAAAVIGVGTVLAVGIHPPDDPSPLARVLTADGTSTLAIALRSSTRAVPLILFGACLLIGARLSARTRRGHLPRAELVVAAATIVAIANLPAWTNGGFVDPGLVRDPDPPASWYAGAETLDAQPSGARVLQVPGAEFGSFRWGHTVDQPLVALTDRPLVTRDLLPLGSAGAMDLLYAFDDRIQEETLEVRSVAPVARLLGADVIWVVNDLAHERYRTARPEPLGERLRADPDLSTLSMHGEPIPNRPDPPRLDGRALADDRIGQPVEPVHLLAVAEPQPVIRAKTEVIAFSGSGDGIVDAAAAGLIDGSELLLSTAWDPQLALDEADRLILTDSNRTRARHWRGSQDVHGHTESRDPALALLDPPAGDARLEPTPAAEPDAFTWAEQIGPIRATASGYGEPAAWRPESRPAMAIDGDPDTAWVVADRADPIGERFRLLTEVELDALIILQPETADDARHIAEIRISLDDGTRRTVALDDRSRSSPGQRVELPLPVPSGVIDLEITAVTGNGFGPVGFAEVTGISATGAAVEPTVEVIRPASAAMTAADADLPVAIVLTRLRVDATNRWRSDPESRLIREITMPERRTFELDLTMRIDPRATDDMLADLLGANAVASDRLLGVPGARGHAAVDEDPTTAWITPIDGALGAHLDLIGLEEVATELRIRQATGPFSTILALDISDASGSRRVLLPEDAAHRGDEIRIPLDRPIGPGPVRITIVEIAEARAVDRRYGDPVILPAAIANVDFGVPLMMRPSVAGADCRHDVLYVDGRPIPIRVDVIETDPTVDPTVDQITEPVGIRAIACDQAITLGPGSTMIETASGVDHGLQVDRIVLRDLLSPTAEVSSATATASAVATATVVSQDRLGRDVQVTGCSAGCWLVVGEGWAEPWEARLDGTDLGPPVLVDGGFNGWYVDPSILHQGSGIIHVRWTAQRPLTIAWVATAVGVLGCLALVARDPRRRPSIWRGAMPRALAATTRRGSPWPRLVRTAIAWGLAAGAVIGPWWALWAVIATLVASRVPRPRPIALISAALMTIVGIGIVVVERLDAPPPNFDWPLAFSAFHGLSLLAVSAMVVSAFVEDSDAGSPAQYGPRR